MARSPTSLRVVTFLLLIAQSATASDWPMWRYDAGHTASTPHELPAELHLQWVRELPKPRPAWPASQYKLQFDASYEPVVMGSTIFVPSMVADSVTAYDTGTGEEKWRFYADGPVRFAPVAWSGAVYFVSDDGCLYCLNADDGTLKWKFNGGPSDRKALGNDRLVSSWPARGAPVLYDGTIYFAASIWPFMGIFIHALDARTGEVVWSNTGSGSVYIKQPHSAPSFAGVAPQGYLVATDDSLLIPGGRSAPACYDRATGALRYFHINTRQFGKATGGYDVLAQGDWLFNGGAILKLSDGSGRMKAGASVLTEDAVLHLANGAVSEGSMALSVREIVKKDRRGREIKIKVYSHERTRRAAVDPSLTRLFLKADQRLHCGGNGVVAAVLPDFDLGTSEVVWRSDIDGEPWSMIAADDRLFVVTREGKLYCFGESETEPRLHRLRPDRPSAPDRWTKTARQILDTTGQTEGYCVVRGVGTGRLAEELARQSSLHVIATDSDEAKARSLREKLDRQGLYGSRVSVHVSSSSSLSLPPYLASLVVSEQPDDVFHLLRPYGGTACLLQPDLAQTIMRAKLPNVRVAKEGPFTILRREGALKGSADWTHQYADAANSVMSKDQIVRAPFGLLWFGGPANDKILPRHGHGPTPHVVGGRLFIEGQHLLRSVDVYTGRLLWERDFPELGYYYRHTGHHPGANEIGSNYVSVPDAVYVAYQDAILKLDPASGRTAVQFRRTASSAAWGYLGVWKNLLVATASPLLINPTDDKKPKNAPKNLSEVIPPNDQWAYLAGSHPPSNWIHPHFDVRGWKRGKAGFGYGDNDDKTVLDMKGKYTVVYTRRTFDASAAANATEMGLMIRYDDAFITYLNGKEVLRVGVGKGSGANATGFKGHEAGQYEYFPIGNFTKHLRKGVNVIAIEGHNGSPTSSDFTLDPYLVVSRLPDGAKVAQDSPLPPMQLHEIEGVDLKAKYSSASKELVAMDRHTGNVLWTREAQLNFRHNAIAIAAGKVFCIDAMSPKKRAYLKRRGCEPSGTPQLLALDARTGRVVWSATADVFGTWLGYSEQHDILLQAGSPFRDRAKDEVTQGMIAYRGSDGTVLWRDLGIKYYGPPVLWRDLIVTNGGGGGAGISLLTGKHTGWRYSRNYGCNTVIASEHLLTFRSGAAGYCDMLHRGGTGNLGGFKTGCTSNLIAANGVLNAPDYTRTCSCAYQNQCSLALVHDPDAEMWTFGAEPTKGRLGINFGAPGDRRADDGTLWLDYPSVGGPSPAVTLTVAPDNVSYFRKHSAFVEGTSDRWIAASGVEGLQSISIELPSWMPPARLYTVHLHFCEPQEKEPGDRVFGVIAQGITVIDSLDIVKEARAHNVSLVKQLRGLTLDKSLTVSFTPSTGAPLLCGIEIVARGEP